jgi:hypothetical protein
MAGFDDREKALEIQYAKDEEFRFRVNAKAVRLLGLWAAEKLGHAGAAADKYAEELVDADFEEQGSHDVFRKLMKDMQFKSIDISERQLEHQYNIFLAEARKALAAI